MHAHRANKEALLCRGGREVSVEASQIINNSMARGKWNPVFSAIAEFLVRTDCRKTFESSGARKPQVPKGGLATNGFTAKSGLPFGPSAVTRVRGNVCRSPELRTRKVSRRLTRQTTSGHDAMICFPPCCVPSQGQRALIPLVPKVTIPFCPRSFITALHNQHLPYPQHVHLPV